jgi:ATP-dependent exoDNAse (exonuclease V) alpha subunit
MAGDGKTTMLRSAREVWEARGYQVQGVALAAVAAQGLENEAKIPSQTIAKLFYSIDHPQKDARPLLNDRTVLVVDEAGMVGTLQMARLVEEAEKAGAKLALVGDERQLQPIEQGAPFKTFGALSDLPPSPPLFSLSNLSDAHPARPSNLLDGTR